MDVFFDEDEKLLKRYNEIQNNVSNKIFPKTKIKSYVDEAADFHDKEISKVGSDYACLAVTLIDFVLKKHENYYSQVFFKKCKYIEKDNQIYYCDVDVSSDDSD